jgi:hypothetical protein
MKPLTIADKAILRPYFDAFEVRASEISFTNLFMWRHKYHFHYEILEGFLYFINVKNPDTRYYSQPIGDYTDAGRLKESLAALKAREGEVVFKKVDGTFLEAVRTLGIPHEAREERDAFDYLYDFQGLRDLPGKDYHKKKNHVNKFLKTYENWQYLKLDEDTLPLARAVNDAWFEGVEEADLLSEKQAIEEAFNHMKALDFTGGLITIDESPAAFTLGEALNGDTLVVHIEKALGPYQGLYAMINQQFLQHQPEGFVHVNREQDLGIEGLRKAKLSYRPVGFVAKHILRL